MLIRSALQLELYIQDLDTILPNTIKISKSLVPLGTGYRGNFRSWVPLAFWYRGNCRIRGPLGTGYQ